jgi:hypothetical protein
VNDTKWAEEIADYCLGRGGYEGHAEIVAHLVKHCQPQTDARVADLLFKLDVAATTFEKVTTSEHREAVFNAEHAKLLRDTIKALRQPQTDALKRARERITEWCDAVADNWGQGSETHNVARDGRDIVLAALKESK